MILVSYHCLYINEQLSIRVWMGIFYGFLDHVSRVLNKYTQNCSWNKYSLNIPNETCQIIYSCNCPCGITMRPWVIWYILLACHFFVYQLQCSKVFPRILSFYIFMYMYTYINKTVFVDIDIDIIVQFHYLFNMAIKYLLPT